MRIIAAQINPTVGDFEGNFHKILTWIDSARKQNVQIIAFPELSLCGYPPEDLLLHKDFVAKSEEYIPKLAKASEGIAVIVGLVRKAPLSGEKPICNSAAIFYDGNLLGFHDKWLLPTYDVFDERRYFEPGTMVRTWPLFGKKVAVMICEDIWHHGGFVDWIKYLKDPITDLAKLQPDILINISASPYHFDKVSQRTEVCAKSASTLACPVILCCQVGGNDQLVFDGFSMYVDEKGSLRKLAGGFVEEEMLIDTSGELPILQIKQDPVKDLFNALVLGVRDYFFKQGFTKACLGLSGGIDSALCACIATEALGKQNVLALAMPSRFSSESSTTDAKKLVENLGIHFQIISIEKEFSSFLDTFEPYFTAMPMDTTEENLQARIRGMILMAFSNKLGYLVISPANKSESAVGYSTLYGDMCGGLAAISDVTKTQVYQLARFINREREIIPISTMEKAPSAELRPNQKDIDTLPDYDTLDKIIQAYVEEYLSPEQICRKYHFSNELVGRIVFMIHKAEYKRRQAPPGIRVSKKAFRVGRQFPIVQKWK